MAAERFSLLLDTRTTGTAEVAALEQQLKRVVDIAETSGRKSADVGRRNADALRSNLASIKEAVQNPLQAAGEAVEDFALKFGKIGVIGAGVVAGLAGAATAIFSLANATQNLAEEQSNAADVLGLTVKEYGLFDQAAKNAGVSSQALLGTMRGLSKALADSSEEGKQAKRALADIGVTGTDVYGAIRPTKDLLIDIAEGLRQIQSPAERADASIKIFNRSGLQMLALLKRDIRETVEELDRLGVGFDEAGAQKANEFGNRLDILSSKFQALKKDVGLAAISIIDFFVDLRTAREKERDINEAIDLGLASQQKRELAIPAESIRALQQRGTGAGLSQEQLLGTLNRDAKSQISRLIEEKDDQSRLAKARQEMAEAVRENDISGVKLAQSRIRSLENQIQSAQKLKAAADQFKRVQEEVDKALEKQFGLLVSGGGLLSTRGTQDLGAVADAQLSVSLRQLALGRGPGIGERDAVEGLGTDKVAALLETRKNAEEDLRAVKEESNRRALDALEAQTDLQIRYIELLAGPGGEVDAINKITVLRLQSLEQQKALGRDVFDIQIEQFRVQEERELRILELKKQQREETRRSGEALFDAALSGGGGLKRFALSTVMTPARTAAGNLAAELFGGSTGKLQLPGLTDASGKPNLAGRLLQGTPFGIDPLKNATDLNTQATQQNTAALMTVSGGGTAGGIAGTAGGILSGMSGTNPLIFHGLGGGGGGDVLSGIQNQQRGTRGLESLFGIKTSTGGGLARGVGIAGLLGGAAFGAYSGFSAGGAQGALTGSSSILGGAAGLLPLLGVAGPAAPILAAGALGLAGISALIGDPKKREAERIDKMLEAARYPDATGMNYVGDTRGRALDYNQAGQIRVYSVNVNVSTMDAASFRDNAPRIIEAWTEGLKNGQGGDVLDTIRQGL